MFFLISDFEADKAEKVFCNMYISSADRFFLGLFPINEDAADDAPGAADGWLNTTLTTWLPFAADIFNYVLHNEYVQFSHYATWNL